MEDSIEAKVGVLYLIHFVQFSSTLGSSHIHPPSTYSIGLIVIPQAFTVSYLSQTVFWCFLSLSVIFTIMSQPGINIALLNQQNSLKCHYTLSRCSPDLGALLQLILDSLPWVSYSCVLCLNIFICERGESTKHLTELY